MEEALKDKRFSHIISDPRFRKMPKHVRKVTLDKRMQKIFKDSRFKEKCQIDKRGRTLNLTPTENLKKLYDMSSESSDEDEKEEEYTDENNVVNENESKQSENSHKKSTSIRKSSIKDTSEESDDSDDSETSDNLEDQVNESLKGNSRSEDSGKNKKTNVEKSNKVNGEQNRKANVEKSKKDSQKSKRTTVDETKEDSQEVNEFLKGNSHSKDFGKNKKANVEKSKKDNVQKNKKDSQKSKKTNIEETKEDSQEGSSDESDDSDSESDDSSEDRGEEFDHKWEELRNEAPDTNEIYRRLAVCNMDWDRIKAIDLFVCFDSFKPCDGRINCVKIYPSDYGLRRMEEEKLKGPPELVEKTLNEELQGSKYHREKLRMYQINRLKYYYAIVDCDSPETANVLHDQLNGMEYESTSVRFDLRFVPDDVTFDHEPTSTADKLPYPTEYKPNLFVNSALQQVNKVHLTWDETDPKRKEFFEKIFSDPDSVQNDINDFLASPSSESEVEEENISEELDKSMKTKDPVTKYRELLLLIEEQERAELEEKQKYVVEVTWVPAFTKSAGEKIQEKIKRSNLNSFEEMLHKKKEQKAMHKQARDSNDSKKFFVKEENISDEKLHKSIGKYKKLLSLLEEKQRLKLEIEEDCHAEVTWTPGIKKNVEKQIQEKIERSNLNPFEEMLRKKKEDRKKKKREQKAMLKQARDSDDSDEEFFGDTSTSSGKTKEEKRLAELALISNSKEDVDFEEKSRKKNKNDKSRDLDNFVGNPHDPRFAAMYTSSLFNKIQSNPHVKKNDGKHIGKSEKRKFKSKKFYKSYKKAKY